MSKNRNSFLKRQREIQKKEKAQEKREKRRLRLEKKGEPGYVPEADEEAEAPLELEEAITASPPPSRTAPQSGEAAPEDPPLGRS